MIVHEVIYALLGFTGKIIVAHKDRFDLAEGLPLLDEKGLLRDAPHCSAAGRQQFQATADRLSAEHCKALRFPKLHTCRGPDGMPLT